MSEFAFGFLLVHRIVRVNSNEPLALYGLNTRTGFVVPSSSATLLVIPPPLFGHRNFGDLVFFHVQISHCDCVLLPGHDGLLNVVIALHLFSISNPEFILQNFHSKALINDHWGTRPWPYTISSGQLADFWGGKKLSSAIILASFS